MHSNTGSTAEIPLPPHLLQYSLLCIIVVSLGDELTYAMVLKFSRTILQSSHSYIV